MERTALFGALRAEILAFRPGLVILDNAAKLFAISENDRAMVTRALGYLNELAIEFDTAILLILHNNKIGEFSGSTAWENAARARLSLKRDSEVGTVKLSRPKANYAADGEVTLRWNAGAFHCETVGAQTQGERLTADIERRKQIDTFLRALDTLTAQQRAVSHSKQASNYVARIMRDAGLVDGMSDRQIKDTMELLFSENRLIADAELWQKPNRHWAVGLARSHRVTPQPPTVTQP